MLHTGLTKKCYNEKEYRWFCIIYNPNGIVIVSINYIDWLYVINYIIKTLQ